MNNKQLMVMLKLIYGYLLVMETELTDYFHFLSPYFQDDFELDTIGNRKGMKELAMIKEILADLIGSLKE